MNWLKSLLLLGTIGGVHLQCFTAKDDEFAAASYSNDLSGITDFGINLYKRLSPGNSPKNFFFSPYSIWTALALAYFGSSGNTERELRRTLNLPEKLSAMKLWRDLEQL